MSCDDLDECAAGTADCDPRATCTNLPGGAGYECHCTAVGYAGDGFFCTDVDECVLEAALPTASPHDCHADATCTNQYGYFNCSCDAGYEGNGTWCDNINECANATLNDAKYRTGNRGAVPGSKEDWTRFNPWRAPGLGRLIWDL